MVRIAKNELYQSFRDKKARRTVSIDKVIVADLFEEFEESFNEERKEKLMEALRLINEKDLALIELRYFERRSYREIGEIISVTENNAKLKPLEHFNVSKKYTTNET